MTTRWVALLRGVNIGKRRMPMAELRAVLTDLGLGGVATYLQSGNAVFDAPHLDRVALTRDIESTLLERFGFAVPVILRTTGELDQLIRACPYSVQAEADPTSVHVMFLDPMPSAAVWEELDLGGHHPEEIRPGNGALYMHLPQGMGRAGLPAVLEKAVLPSLATTRNWRTVLNLALMGRGD